MYRNAFTNQVMLPQVAKRLQRIGALVFRVASGLRAAFTFRSDFVFSLTILMSNRLTIFHTPGDISCNTNLAAGLFVRLHFCAAVQNSSFEAPRSVRCCLSSAKWGYRTRVTLDSPNCKAGGRPYKLLVKLAATASSESSQRS